MKGQISLVLFIVIALALGLGMLVLTVKPPRVIPEIYEGEFSDISLPKEVAGTDLKLGEIKSVKGEYMGMAINATTTYLTTANKPLVVGSEQLYANDTRVEADPQVSYSVVSYSEGNFSITVTTNGNRNMTIDYRYEKTYTDVFIKTDEKFESPFLVKVKPVKGLTYDLAIGFELDDSVKLLRIEGERVNSSIEIRRAYVLEDKEGISLDLEDALWVGSIENKQEFELEAGPIPEGEYILNLEIRALNDIVSGTKLFDKIEFEAETEGDLDEGTVSISVEA